MKGILKSSVAAILQWEAKHVLHKYRPRIIAITGSVGKTSGKEAIYAALEKATFVRKSEKSFNTEIGIPLTVLGCPNAWSNPFKWVRNFIEGILLLLFSHPYPRVLVLEVSADRPGDIQKIAGWLEPDVVVVTRLPDIPVHVEYFGSPRAVIEEKSYLPRALKPGGTLVLNADDPETLRFRSVEEKIRVVTYGFGSTASVRASNERVMYEEGRPVGMSFHVLFEGSSVPFMFTGVLGRQHIYAALAAVAVGVSEGRNLLAISEALKEHVGPPGRMRILKGIEDSILIDDSYNSSPVAAEEALRMLFELEVSGKKMVVLGDMLELGLYSVEAHQHIGSVAAGSVDFLITVGPRARDMLPAATKGGLKKKQMIACDDAYGAAEALRAHLEKGDIVLIKGSQSIRLERAVEQVMAEPRLKRELLVRQDAAWQRR